MVKQEKILSAILSASSPFNRMTSTTCQSLSASFIIPFIHNQWMFDVIQQNTCCLVEIVTKRYVSFHSYILKCVTGELGVEWVGISRMLHRPPRWSEMVLMQHAISAVIQSHLHIPFCACVRSLAVCMKLPPTRESDWHLMESREVSLHLCTIIIKCSDYYYTEFNYST